MMSRLLGPLLACVMAGFALGSGGWARAQDFDARPRPSAEDRRRAVELFEQSRHALRSGDYEEARDMLLEAYRLFPQPALRVSLARAYDGLSDEAHAIEHYEAYLEEEPDAPDRGEIEGRLVELRAQAREEAGEPEPPPPPPPSGPDQTGPLVGYTLLGFGIAGLVGGGALAGVASSELGTATRASTTQLEAQAAYGRARDLGTVSVALLAGGGAVALGGLIVALVSGESSSPAEPPRGRARVSLGLGGLTVEGSF
ncbi:MAG: hypothetical protein K1X94_11650 [Sandaracinaceae bacterium]|nr:hypothetical protein [Sandaracinaceae bacterium]